LVDRSTFDDAVRPAQAEVISASLLCPSARPEMPGARIFGIVGGTANCPRVGYLDEPRPATDELLSIAQPAVALEVFRITAPCEESKCQHFDGNDCKLARRIIQILPPVVTGLPPCSIRSGCRWWKQEGKDACLRCPQIVTQVFGPSELLVQVASPQPLRTMGDSGSRG
jgi:hypothetical protein